MDKAHRSRCPINLTLETLGDEWSLLILRDMIFGASGISTLVHAFAGRL